MTFDKNYLIIFMTILSVQFFVNNSIASNYTKDELFKMGGIEMSGTVTKVGVYNFFIRNSDGEELNIHTDIKLTKFYPEENERLMVGDEINFIYMNPESASLSTEKMLAVHIDFVNKIPRIFITEKIECVISFSQRNEKSCYFPKYNKTVSFEGMWPELKYHGRSFTANPGDKVFIKLKVVPANIGNGYVYKIDKVEAYDK